MALPFPHTPFGHLLPLKGAGEGLNDHRLLPFLPTGEGGRRPDEGKSVPALSVPQSVFPERNQPSCLVIPQCQMHRCHGAPDCEFWCDVLQGFVCGHAGAEAVVGDAAGKVVNVVEADITGEPVEHRR